MRDDDGDDVATTDDQGRHVPSTVPAARRLTVVITGAGSPLRGQVEIEGTKVSQAFHGVVELVAAVDRLLEALPVEVIDP